MAVSGLSYGGEVYDRNPDFLLETWQEHEGLLESSALAIAQTSDGYLWVGTSGGLVRFDGNAFLPVSQLTELQRVAGAVSFLQTDRSGRLWVDGEQHLAVCDQGTWKRIAGANFTARSVAEDSSGTVLIGGGTGELVAIVNGAITPAPLPPGIKPSGVFCINDPKDGGIWLANKGFIGRQKAGGWERVGPSGDMPSTLVAAPAQNGGVWIYTPGQLRHFQADGTITLFPAPNLLQPRDMIEDHGGTLWIATITQGLVRFRPGGTASFIDNTKGLTHGAVRCVYEGREGNIWAGGSLNGLNRLKARQFLTISRAQGLPDNAVRTIAEIEPGKILVGTHGGGIASIHYRKVEPVPSFTGDSQDKFVWSLLQDRTGRLWIGTFSGGLFVEEHGVRRKFPLPAAFLNAVAQIMEDRRGRIWVGGPGALGIIEGEVMTRCFTNTIIDKFATTCLAEDTNTDTIWLGTYTRGLFKIDGQNPARITPVTGLPGNRISFLKMDADGSVWIGVYDHGIACLHPDGVSSLFGSAQGWPAERIGSMLDDGRGSFWLGTTMGILRITSKDLHRFISDPSSPVNLNIFTVSDGLGSDNCAEGYQPNAIRDHAGHLWFSTDRGLVTVDPAKIRLNPYPPPVTVESVTYTDHSGTHTLYSWPGNSLVFPAGTVMLQFNFAGLSYTAPEKVQFKYRLEGAENNWLNLGNTHQLLFRDLAHGRYALHLTAANNDGVWNPEGITLNFVIRPFIWQTLWFRLLAAAAAAIACGFTVRRATHWQFQQRIDQMQRQRAVEQQAEAEIQRREKHFRSLIEHASDTITVISQDATITYQSTAGERMLGRPADSIIGRKLIELVHPEDADKTRAALEQSLGQMNSPVTLVTRLQHQDGSWRTVETVGTCIQTETNGKQVILNTRDITENLKLEEKLRQAQKMEAIGRLAGGVAHDFNNILSSIIMQNELLCLTEKLPPGARDGLKQIAADSTRAADLVRQLLLFSRRQIMQSRLVDLNSVVTNMGRMLQRLIREDVQLQMKPHPTPLMTFGDISMIEQVVLNLAVNARDAMTQGGQLRIETSETTLAADFPQKPPELAPGRYVCVSVIDTGGGIAPEIMPRIFEPFFTTKEQGRGTGLGLATVFGIVQQHHGWINVKNAPGQGVTFQVFLPASREAATALAKNEDSPKPRGGTETILLAEDEQAVRKSITMILEHFGYKILEAANASEAITLWQKHQADISLLLTDLVMPGEMGGRALGRKLKTEQPGLKVIYLSGYSAEIAGRDFHLQPGELFIQKPFATARLLDTVRRCLDE